MGIENLEIPFYGNISISGIYLVNKQIIIKYLKITNCISNTFVSKTEYDQKWNFVILQTTDNLVTWIYVWNYEKAIK